MTIHLPTRPAPGRAKARRRYIPDRPEGGYHVTTGAFVPVEEKSASECRATILRSLGELNRLEVDAIVFDRKIATVSRKLVNPRLADLYPADHPLRIAAEDKRDRLIDQQERIFAKAIPEVALIVSAGKHLPDVDLATIGRELLTVGEGALSMIDRVYGEGAYIHRCISILRTVACPF